MHTRFQFCPFATRALVTVSSIGIASGAFAITASDPGTPVGPGARTSTAQGAVSATGSERGEAPGTAVGPGIGAPGSGPRAATAAPASPFSIIVNPQPFTAITAPGVPVGPAAPQ